MRGRRHGVQAARWMGVRGAVAWAEGGGPQGATLGLLEIVNLLTVGITSFNIKHQA